MPNVTLTIDKVAKEAARVFVAQSSFLKAVNTQFDGSFAEGGAKIGNTLRVRKPFRPTVRSGRVANVQDYVEEFVSLPCTNYYGIDLRWTTQEMTFDLDMFSERVLKPQISTLAAYVDYVSLQAVWYKIANVVGTPGTVPANMQVWGDANARLDDNMAPRDNNRWAIVSPDAMARTTYGSSALFHKSSAIEDQYANGVVQDAVGMRWMMDQQLLALTNGTRVVGDALIDDVAQAFNTEGSTTIHVDDLTSATATYKKGEVITVAGVYEVNPLTKQSLGYLKRFTLTADATAASNEVDLAVYPAMYSSVSGGRQNLSAFPADGAVVTELSGVASTGPYTQSIVMHKDAFVFASADLEMPFSGQASRARAGNVGVRIWKQSDVVNDTHMCRLDTTWGIVDCYQEWATRVTS